MINDTVLQAIHFSRTRWFLNFHDRQKLESWQQHQLQRFFRLVLPAAPRFQQYKALTLDDLPYMDKAVMMDNFQACNTADITLDQVLPIALQSETSRDFTPMINGLTVGLSSGTSGNRGVFLVSKAERLRWAGILLGRALPSQLLSQLLSPWKPALRIAFFLRANSNLYTTLNNRRIQFSFYDLFKGVEASVPQLNASQPDILVGPPPLLRALAMEAIAGRLNIQPRHIISVAEVLENRDAQTVETAFGMIPHQLYQATEGFLAYTCEHGTLHLNESFVHIEPEWLDSTHSRFQPVITDFTRSTQLIVRYRLNDILRLKSKPCPCGRAERSIEAIEGRADEVLWLPSSYDGQAIAVFPDFIRRVLLLAGSQVKEYSVHQQGMSLHIQLLTGANQQSIRQALSQGFSDLWKTLKVQHPSLHFNDWQAPAITAKRQRVRMLSLPQGLTCAF